MDRGNGRQARWMEACDAARRAALAAWGAIAAIYEGSYMIEEKAEGPTTEADRLADLLIVEHLSKHHPVSEYGYLTEESEDEPQRLRRERVWIIDPIDGTRDFINHTGNFAIHIALAERLDDGLFHPVAAVVHQPIGGRMYSAVRGAGAWRQQVGDRPGPLAWRTPCQPIRVSRRNRLDEMRSVVSNSNRTSRLMRLILSLNLEAHWHIGSMGVKMTTIAEGEAELYVVLVPGRPKEWDTCAPQLVLEEAGGMLTDLEGQIVHYNKQDVYHRQGLLASNGVTHQVLVDQVRRFVEEEALG